MRIQHERAPIHQLARTLLDATDARVAVFHRRRELACLKRRAHALALARRHAAMKHECFGASADGAVLRADDDLVWAGPRQRLGSELSAARFGDPERAGDVR